MFILSLTGLTWWYSTVLRITLSHSVPFFFWDNEITNDYGLCLCFLHQPDIELGTQLRSLTSGPAALMVSTKHLLPFQQAQTQLTGGASTQSSLCRCAAGALWVHSPQTPGNRDKVWGQAGWLLLLGMALPCHPSPESKAFMVPVESWVGSCFQPRMGSVLFLMGASEIGLKKMSKCKNSAVIQSWLLPFEGMKVGWTKKTKSKPKATQKPPTVLESASETITSLFSVS